MTRRRVHGLVACALGLCAAGAAAAAAMAHSLRRLLGFGHAGTVAYEAHSEQPLTWQELGEVTRGIGEIAAGRATPQPMCLGGTPMRRFNVGAFPIVLPVPDGQTLAPMGSVTETLDWEGGPCKNAN